MQTLGYTAYQARSQWYMQHFGLPVELHKSQMEDGKTQFAVMEFDPKEKPFARNFWTYATNGMSERRMPCESEPHGDPRLRMELIAYSSQRALWICDLLKEMANYPFIFRSGFAIGHTLPVESPNGLWNGYLLSFPTREPKQLFTLGIDVGIKPDIVGFAQVIGLKKAELAFGIEHGGLQLREMLKLIEQQSNGFFLDVDNASVLN